MSKIIAISGKQGSGKNEVGKIIQFLTSGLNERDVRYISDNSVFYSELSNWKERSFAYKVREALSVVTGIPMETLLRNDIKYKPVKEFTGISWMENGIEMTIRRALQKMGTDAIRMGFHTDTWVKAVQTEIVQHPEHNHFISDVRFQNEYNAMNDMGALMIRVIRYLTSEQWQKKFINEVKVTDPDGWNRMNFKYSWFEERISQLEFEKRLINSTCQFKVPVENISFNHQSETELDNVDITDWHYLIDNDTDNIQDLINKTKRILEEENII